MKNDKGGHMKDLDLDELHEAVNKLMVQAQKPKAKREPSKSVAKAVSRPTVKVAERSAQDDKPQAPAENEAAPVAVTVRTKPAAKVMPKKRGMAMDVVQAAKPTSVTPPSARAARTAPTLQPTGQVAAEPPKPREAAEPTPAEPSKPAPQDVADDVLASLNMQTDGDAKPKKTLFDDEKPATSAFPDPLDVHGFTADEPKENEPKARTEPEKPATMVHTTPTITPDEPATEPEKVPLPEPAEKSQWDMPADESAAAPAATPEQPETPAPEITAAPEDLPATPFVNTKVEKRPLGTYAAAAAPAPAPPAKQDEPKPVAPEEKTEPASIGVPAAPAELRPEVVAVESADVDYSQPVADAKKSDEPLGDLRQMAIPQQYHEHDTSPKKDERPVFDTKDYHPPLQPVATAKHHSGSKAGTILTLILIVLLVAAAVAAYFVATGSIDLTSLL